MNKFASLLVVFLFSCAEDPWKLKDEGKGPLWHMNYKEVERRIDFNNQDYTYLTCEGTSLFDYQMAGLGLVITSKDIPSKEKEELFSSSGVASDLTPLPGFGNMFLIKFQNTRYDTTLNNQWHHVKSYSDIDSLEIFTGIQRLSIFTLDRKSLEGTYYGANQRTAILHNKPGITIDFSYKCKKVSGSSMEKWYKSKRLTFLAKEKEREEEKRKRQEKQEELKNEKREKNII